MSFKQRWNSPKNKAAMLAVPISLFGAVGVVAVVGAMGGNVTFPVFGIIWLFTYAFTAGSMMKRAG